MKQAGSFLARFQKLTPPNDALRRALVDAVKNASGVTITRSQVKVVRGTAFITCSSIAKNAIRVARGRIFEELEKILPQSKKEIRDIR